MMLFISNTSIKIKKKEEEEKELEKGGEEEVEEMRKRMRQKETEALKIETLFCRNEREERIDNLQSCLLHSGSCFYYCPAQSVEYVLSQRHSTALFFYGTSRIPQNTSPSDSLVCL